MENEQLKVSIVTASYNYQDYIKETIESVINQTYPNWEMIIVDDGSKDNSVEVIKSYCEKDSRIKLFQHEGGVNKGLSETVQLGIQKAENDWIIFLESDDTIEPNYIEEKLKVIEQYPDVKFIFNDVNLFGDKKLIRKYEKNYFSKQRLLINSIKYPANIAELLKKYNVVPTFSCVMLHKEILKNVNWESPIKKVLDYFLWSQIAFENDLYYVDKKLSNWRLYKNSYVNLYKAGIEQELNFRLNILQNLTKGYFVYEDFLYFTNRIEKYWEKYKKYKKLFNISCVVFGVIFVIFLVILFGIMYWRMI